MNAESPVLFVKLVANLGFINESGGAGFGGTGCPSSSPLHLTPLQRPPKSTAPVDSRMFSEPYLDKNKKVLVLDLICLLED